MASETIFKLGSAMVSQLFSLSVTQDSILCDHQANIAGTLEKLFPDLKGVKT